MERFQPVEPLYCEDSDDDCFAVDSESEDESDIGSGLSRLTGKVRSVESARMGGPVLDTFESAMEAELLADVKMDTYSRHAVNTSTTATSDEIRCRQTVNSDANSGEVDCSAMSLHSDTKMCDGALVPESSHSGQYDAIYFDSDDDSQDGDISKNETERADVTEDPTTANNQNSLTVAASPSNKTADVHPQNAQTRKKVRFACGAPGTKTSGRGRNRRGVGRRATARAVISNDDLFYDPDMDEDNQNWVDAQRLYYQPPQVGAPDSNQEGLPSTDAVLNCPGCMTMLCLDCQRHETYRNQYRAMFVFNCSVRHDEKMEYRRSKKARSRRAESVSAEVYRPVSCSTCKTEVAVFDSNEVYHFFNVISSHS